MNSQAIDMIEAGLDPILDSKFKERLGPGGGIKYDQLFTAKKAHLSFSTWADAKRFAKENPGKIILRQSSGEGYQVKY